MKKTIVAILVCGFVFFGLTGCGNDKNKNVTLEDLNNVNNEIINYFLSDEVEYKNLAFNYIDEEKKVVIVGLLENTEEQQKEFKNEVVDSHLIEFVQGSENINLPKYK